MTLLLDSLSLWEIAHRWNNIDPKRFRIGPIPVQVRDSIRNMLRAINTGDLETLTISIEKWYPGSDIDPEMDIRMHMKHFDNAFQDIKYDKKFLQSIVLIGRYEMHSWCEEAAIPKPEFWFPEWDEVNWKREIEEIQEKAPRAPTRSKITCQEIAKGIWKEQPELTIAAMIKQDILKIYGHSSNYEDKTVRKWLSEVAPEHVKSRRGRPKKDT